MDNNIKNKLTNSAKEALNEASREIIMRILEEAYKNAQVKRTADIEISLSDILEAKEKILNERAKLDKNKNRNKRKVFLFRLSSMLYILFGLLLYIISIIDDQSFIINSNLGMIISMLGFAIFFFSFYIEEFYEFQLMRRNIHKEQYESDDFELVKKWQVIEKLTRKLIIKNGIDKNKSISFNYILEYLYSLIGNEEFHKLRDLLRARNLILHENYKLEKNKKNDLLKFSSKIIDLLEDKLK